jgi:hypothetical protein
MTEPNQGVSAAELADLSPKASEDTQISALSKNQLNSRVKHLLKFLKGLAPETKTRILKWLSGFGALAILYTYDFADMLNFIKSKFGSIPDSILNILKYDPNAIHALEKLESVHRRELATQKAAHESALTEQVNAHQKELAKQQNEFLKRQEDIKRMREQQEALKESQSLQRLIDTIAKHEKVLKLGVGGMFLITLALGAYKSWPYIKQRWIESSAGLASKLKSSSPSTTQPKRTSKLKSSSPSTTQPKRTTSKTKKTKRVY